MIRISKATSRLGYDKICFRFQVGAKRGREHALKTITAFIDLYPVEATDLGFIQRLGHFTGKNQEFFLMPAQGEMRRIQFQQPDY